MINQSNIPAGKRYIDRLAWVAVVPLLSLIVATHARADTVSINAADWQTDRYPPASVTNGVVGGQNALNLTASSADSLTNRPAGFQYTFYNTQGVYQALNPGATVGAWSLSADLYVTQDMIDGVTPLSESLWAGTGSNSGYYIIDLTSGISQRSYGSAAAPGSFLEVWDDLAGTWTQTADPLTLGWNNFLIQSDGVNNVNYFVDGVNIFNQTGRGGVAGDPAIGDLSGVYLENDNFFGGGNGVPDQGSYTASWSDVNASVPDAVSTALGLALALTALAGAKRLTRASAQ